ncbi:hypothetical protein HJC23_003326 [Cyclotella cryptica]|uniref:AMP-dependent synthetase/ligase domain-containing protein n=1 Tax=Cyclotella cryptica TaxID=29204 RepID=A0ABD3QXC3_9STRA|eukprot:CCRYP_000893-RB/>CCRYP_000893-RB protein AED:0.08 eAED:0.08 QI:62/1/1/1/1/1/2/1645/822
MVAVSVATEAASALGLDTIVDRLELHAERTPSKVAVSFLKSIGNETPSVASSWSYAQLNSGANYLAHRLLDNSSKARLSPVPLSPGDRVLLVYPPCSPHFLLSFLACLRAGLIAVPTYPPQPSRKESLASFVGIARGCGASVALTNGEFATLKRVNQLKDAFCSKFKSKSDHDPDGWPEQLAWVVTDSEPLDSPPQHDPLSPRPPVDLSIAFLQYTSGSTSQPKGVAISHTNLAHNLTIITDDLQASTDTVVVSWLPQYHDMGLIGSLLGIIYCGGSGYYMSPITFLARPMAWLEAVTQFKATHLQAPNFAFGLTARKFHHEDYYFGNVETGRKGKKSLDLTSLKHIINGAEPVTETSIEAFERAFRPYGLPSDPSVIYPTYGLAEHTVFVCSGGRGRLTVKRRELEELNKVVAIASTGEAVTEESTTRLLGCGFPSRLNVDVRIVDPESGTALEEDVVGEIWVDSPSKALGYFGNDDVTKSEFHAVLADNAKSPSETNGPPISPSVEYLRTGDLGFFHRGELYICGRLKDLIIVSGRNYYPQDLEAMAESVSDKIRPGCSAAFSIRQEFSKAPEREGEDVVLILELKDPLPKPKELQCVCETIISMVRSEISKEFSLPLSCIVLMKARSVPKTTSGKISRARAKRAFLSGDLEDLYRVNFKGESEHTLFPNEDKEPSSDSLQRDPTITALNAVPSNIQSLERQEIRIMLLDAICQIANVDKSSLADTSPLNTFMDSVSLAQLKGMLEGQYAVKSLSDEYLFRDTTTIKKLVEIVKVGEARDDQISSDSAINAGTPATAAVSRGGIAGALGCPPGVVCCTIM